MPRRLPTQVPQTVSRLLEAGFLKQPPVWYQAVINHPPAPVPPRHPIARPAEDLPHRLRPKTAVKPPPASTKASPSPSTSRSTSASAQAKNAKGTQHLRHGNNAKKKIRAQGPRLGPNPIFYDEDKVRQQFFRDHPWEAYRPTLLVEMANKVGSLSRVRGDPKRMKSYGRNPSVEDFIACTLAAHRDGGLSLSQAYHNTLSSFYALKAEREHARRYAILEAKYFGADLGKSETQRGFEKEERALESWAAWAAGDLVSATDGTAAEAQKAKAPRIKRESDNFTAGEQYLEAAKAFREGRLDLSNFGTEAASVSVTAQAPASSLPAGEAASDRDDFLGLRRTAIRSGEVGPDEAEAVDAAANGSEEGADVASPQDEQRFRKRVGTRGQRM